MKIEAVFDGDLPAVRLSHADVELTLIPGLGAKISSIRWDGTEFLARNPRKPLRPAVYAAPYAEFDASGFDECFPTIGACDYPEYPWEGVQMPDHGEVWSLPWQVVEEAGGLALETAGVRLPYRLRKRVSIPAAGTIQFDYSLVNNCPFPFYYLWSSHPLFQPEPGMRILLPQGVRVLVDWSKDERLGEMWTTHNWPHTRDCRGNTVDLSLIQGPEAGLVDKLYTAAPLPEGWCALYHPDDGRYAAFVFSPAEIPCVGLSINQGGWPVDAQGYYNIGLEPCCGYPDSLALAVARGQACSIQPFHTTHWSLRLLLGRMPAQADLVKLLQAGAKL